MNNKVSPSPIKKPPNTVEVVYNQEEIDDCQSMLSWDEEPGPQQSTGKINKSIVSSAAVKAKGALGVEVMNQREYAKKLLDERREMKDRIVEEVLGEAIPDVRLTK
jgi:hypothetical protein